MIETLVENEVRNELIFPSLFMGGLYVETGVFLGGNLLRVLDYIKSKVLLKDTKVIGIDNFTFSNISVECFAYYNVPMGLPSYLDLVMSNLEGYSNVELINNDSIEALKNFTDGTIDTLFIDDDHDYNHVVRILEVALPKVSEGGIIIGHDWSDHNVSRAVRKVFRRAPDKISSSNGGYLYYL